MDKNPISSSQKLRISFSLLSLWRRGRYQDAIDFYLKKPLPTNEAMEDGLIYDAHISEMVDVEKKLPEEFGGETLTNPQTQCKIVVPYNDHVDLVALLDILDEPIIWENKTGIKDSSDYAQDFQIPLYFLACDLAGYKVDRAIINHYNQMTNQLDRTLIWKTPQEIDRGRNLIDTLYPEIYDYFNKHDILTKDKK